MVGERARDEIDSSQYVGLAQYYMAKDQTSKAIELLEIAKLKTPNNYRPFEILGRLYYSQGEWDARARGDPEGAQAQSRSTAAWPRSPDASSSS